MKTTNTYNGWKNRQTWNVALHINNDYNLYQSAKSFVKDMQDKGVLDHSCLYMLFVKQTGLRGERTPDNIAFDGSRLDYKALNAMMRELVEH